VNNREFNEVVIDPHYLEKHPDIDAQTILGVVMSLDGRDFPPQGRNEIWTYFMADRVKYNDKLYRLVWCTEENAPEFGVVNCFRR
jgi:hypothetical protein